MEVELSFRYTTAESPYMISDEISMLIAKRCPDSTTIEATVTVESHSSQVAHDANALEAFPRHPRWLSDDQVAVFDEEEEVREALVNAQWKQQHAQG